MSLPERSSRAGRCTIGSYRCLMLVLTSALLKLCPQGKRQAVRPMSSYKATVILMAKLSKDIRHKGNYRPISLTNTGENILTKYLKTELNSTLRRHDQVGCISGMWGWLKTCKLTKVTQPKDTMAGMYEFQHPFMMRDLKKLWTSK